MKKLLPLAAALLAILALGPARADQAKPGTRWTLTFEHGPLRIVSVTAPTGQLVYAHYMVMKITNETPLPRDWYPVVKAVTDTGKTYVALPDKATLDAVKAQEDDDALVAITNTSGKIQPKQVLDTVAIFGPMDPEYDRVQVRIQGLADPIAIYKASLYSVKVSVPDVEYVKATDDGKYEPLDSAVVIDDVAYVERNEKEMAALKKEVGSGEIPAPTSEYWEVAEKRVFEMIYDRPGDEFLPQEDLISFEKEHWRVLGTVKVLRKIQM